MKRIQWAKICANVGVAFFSTLSSLLTFDALTGGQVPEEIMLPASLMVALIQGGLSFCKELSEEIEHGPSNKKESELNKKLFNFLTIW